MKSKLKPLIITAIAIMSVVIILAGLLYFGVLHINNPELKGLTVKGVDVSSYQGDIDWPVLVSQDIDISSIDFEKMQDIYIAKYIMGKELTVPLSVIKIRQ